MREEKAPGAAASWIASSFGYAPFNWTYSRALEPEERALIASLGVRPGMRILDLGCGGAATTFYFADAVAPDGEVVGIDNEPGHIAYAEMQRARWGAAAAAEVTFRVEDAQFLPPDLGRFDLIWCSHIVVFFPDPVAILRTLAERHLADGGRIVIRGWMDGPEHHRDFVVWPLDGDGPPGLLERFWAAHSAAVNRSMAKQLGCGSQVPSGAFSVVGLLQEAGLPQIDLLPETVVRRGAALTDWDVRFLSARLRWMAGAAGTLPALSQEDRTRLQQVCGAMASRLPPDFAYLSFGLTAVGLTTAWASTSPPASVERLSPSEEEEDARQCAAYYIPYRVGPQPGLMDRVHAALRTVSPELSAWGRATSAGGHPHIDVTKQVLTENEKTSVLALWTQARSHFSSPSNSFGREDRFCFMELTDPNHRRCLLYRHDFLLIRCGVYPAGKV